jgi:glutaconyl-CoA/methylmalonyl-CoA decarboxylase subunit gamma
MKLEVTVDGEHWTFELDLERGVLRFDGRDVPVRVVQDAFAKVELELAGEKFAIEGWPPGTPEVPGPLVANGEQFRVALVRSSSASSAHRRPSAPEAPSATPAPAPSAPAGGTVVLPPMPGRVVEVRVKAGESVTKGQVLLVLEAMKMRNEVLAPVSGTVVSVESKVGANVRAREPMVTLRPAN